MQSLRSFRYQTLVQTVRNLFRVRAQVRLIELGEEAERARSVTRAQIEDAMVLSNGDYAEAIRSLDLRPDEQEKLLRLNQAHQQLALAWAKGLRSRLPSSPELANPRTSRLLLAALAVLGTATALGLASQRLEESPGAELGISSLVTMLRERVGTSVKPEQVKTRFSDVIGCDEAIAELEELRDFLREPAKYLRRGLYLPKGVLLSGPPGTGKTLLARALAGETGAAFYYCSGSEFDQVIVGLGAKRIRALFERAKATAPSIIFIDEVDAIGGKRSAALNGAFRQAINQVLTEMDGFDSSHKLVVLAATNFAESLDPALVRSGRFDKTISLSPPDLAGRRKLIDYYLGKVRWSAQVDLDALARRTARMTGADIKNLINTAALRAVRTGDQEVRPADIDFAYDRLQMGVRPAQGTRDFSEAERRAVAVHEAGHTLVALLTSGLADVHKVTILPAGPSLGHTALIPKHETLSYTKEDMLRQVDTLLGGRAAEELFLGKQSITTGCGDDLRKATDSLYSFVRGLGMEDDVFLGSRAQPELSQAKNHEIDLRVRKILEDRYAGVKRLLEDKRPAFEAVVERLVEKETLTRAELEAILKPFK